MEILVFDSWANEQITTDFLRDTCPEELKSQVQTLLEEENWKELDELMIPFYNLE